MGRDAVTGWVERYEQAWRAQDVDGLDRLFAEDARYLRSPYDPEPLEGLDAIRGFWADPTPFTMTAAVIAASESCVCPAMLVAPKRVMSMNPAIPARAPPMMNKTMT